MTEEASQMSSDATAKRVVRLALGWVALGVIIATGYVVARPYLQAGPESVAQRFLSAVASRDLPAARALLTDQVQDTEDRTLEAVLAQGATFTIGTTNERGNYATIEFSTPQASQPQQLQLQQQDGRWRVYGLGSGPFAVPD